MPLSFNMDNLQKMLPGSIITIGKSPELTKMIKFALIGLMNTVVGYGAFFILSYYLFYLFALVISHIIGVTNSYIWNKYWTFQTSKNHLREFIRFNSIYLIVLLLNITVLYIFVNGLGINPRIGQIVVLPMVTLISYFGHRYWSFNTK